MVPLSCILKCMPRHVSMTPIYKLAQIKDTTGFQGSLGNDYGSQGKKWETLGGKKYFQLKLLCQEQREMHYLEVQVFTLLAKLGHLKAIWTLGGFKWFRNKLKHLQGGKKKEIVIWWKTYHKNKMCPIVTGKAHKKFTGNKNRIWVIK